MLDVPSGTSPDCLYVGFQQHSDYFIGGACRRMSVSVEMFFTGRNTLKCYYLGDFVRYLKCAALWRFISLCEYIIFQWGPPGNLICVKLRKGVHLQGWKWECGQHFTSFCEFRYFKNKNSPGQMTVGCLHCWKSNQTSCAGLSCTWNRTGITPSLTL